MSDNSDSQNMSEQHADLSSGSSPEGSYYEGERSSPELPKAATRTKKKRTSDDEDEDFVADETTSKKKRVVLAKEYTTNPSARANDKTAVRKVTKETMSITLEEPSATGKKKRARKTFARVVGRPSMMIEEEEEQTADAPPAKTQKLMSDAMRTAPSKSKPKAPATKRSTRNISAAEKNKAPVPEADVDEESLVLRKLKPKIPDHDDAHPVAENMMLRKDKGLRLWRLNDPYAARRRTACDYRFQTREQ
jgi:hypothetical protein